MARIIDLQGGELLRLDATAGARVRVLFGTVWLTESGRLGDIFAASGDEVILDGGAPALIEAQGFARVIVPAPRPVTTFAAVIAALRGAARRLLPVPAFAAN